LKPNEKFFSDIWGPKNMWYEGYLYQLIGTDHFGKAVKVIPTGTMSAKTLIYFIKMMFSIEEL
jgi:hypothetical protein